MSDERTRIRPAGIGDAPALSRLGGETFSESFGHLYAAGDLAAFLESAHSVAAYEALLAEDSRYVRLAEDGAGEPIAYAVAGPSTLPVPEPHPRAGEVSRLYVRQGWQGAGLGRRLLEPMLDWLAERYEVIHISVYSDNPGAQRLYRRYGFEKVGEYRFMVGAHADREFIFERR